ncbi:MAG TPA: tetratricopeptide repeat protein [Thiobacillus sp.]
MSKNRPEPNSVYTAALQAACLNLSAQASDLECLLDPVHAMQVSPQQVSGLLKQLWSRLEALRASQAEVTDAAVQHPELARTLEQAYSYLRAGDTFSLADAYTEFEHAYQASIAVGSPAECVATVRGTQAQIAAVQRDYRRAASLYAEASATPGLISPLQWRYQLQRALTLEDLGRESMDDAALDAAISLYETELLALAPQAKRPDDWATTQHHLGNVLGAVGQRQRGTWMLEKSIMAFECALTVRNRERSPLDWSATQNSLGVTLGILAQRQADTEMLGKSVEAFQLALEARTQDRSPHDWAVTQNNLGAALRALGQRKQDRTLLKQASEAYKSVLQVWTRACVPLEWAVTMDNLGTALRLLGEHRNGPRTLEQAVAAFRSALAERTRASVPQAWAMTQNNLGAALHKLGERQHDAQPLEAAVEAYDNALEEWTRERAPMTWAMTLANQCATRKALAELVGDAEIARRALTDFRAVAEVFREASHAQYYELVTEQVALTQKLEQALLNGEMESDQSDVSVAS